MMDRMGAGLRGQVWMGGTTMGQREWAWDGGYGHRTEGMGGRQRGMEGVGP